MSSSENNLIFICQHLKDRNLRHGYNDSSKPGIFVKLIDSGCERKKALKFVNRPICKYDITQESVGPSGYKIIT